MNSIIKIYNFIDSSFEQDSETCMSSDITSPHSISQLELPTPERLLPVGPQREFSSLVERVRQVLDISDVEGLCANHKTCAVFLYFSEESKKRIFL